MLYLIGLGLSKKNISLEGLEAVKKCSKVFLETYTSLLDCSIDELQEILGKDITPADRNVVEKQAEMILEPAKQDNVALLVIGDPLCATTHQDLLMRAEKEGIKVKVLHNASVISAVGATGLQVYKFGKTASIPFPEGDYMPETPYNILKDNQSIGAHTLFLLDLRPDENKYMTIKDAIEYLQKIEEKRGEKLISPETKFIGCARLGQDAEIKSGTTVELKQHDFGAPVHCLIIPGNLHFIEEESIE